MHKNRDGNWELFIKGIGQGESYKYCIETPWFEKVMKSDPFAFYAENRPDNASRVFDLGAYQWGDGEWQESRRTADSLREPMNIYEIHAGSWKRNEDGSFYTYRQLAEELTDYLCDMHFTHVQFMPLTEHPYDPSWGFQTRDLALRHARGSDVSDRHPAPKGHRRHHGLGTVEFPQGQLRAGQV